MAERNPSDTFNIDIDNEITAEEDKLLNSAEPVSYSDQTAESYNDVDTLYAPFVRPDYPIDLYEKIKLVLNCILLVPIRALLVGFICVIFWVISRLVFIGIDENKRTLQYLHGIRRIIYQSVGIFCRIGLFIGGFYTIERFHISQKQIDKIRSSDLKIKMTNPETDQNKLPYTIVCNHISMMDIIILLSEFNAVSFLALERLKDTLFFGQWMQQINCLFVEENNKQGLVTEVQRRQKQYHDTLEQQDDPNLHDIPPRLVIFPEGTTTNGGYHILFHRGAFMSGLPVQPVMIRYPWNHFCPSWETIPLSTYYARLFTQFRIYCHVIHFPVYYPSPHEQKDPSVYASNVRHVMTKCANRLFTKTDRGRYRGGLEMIKVGNQTRKDKVALHNRILKGEFHWTKNKNF